MNWIKSFFELFRIFKVVEEFELAVLLRFGKFRKVLKPGLHFCLPVIHSLYTMTCVRQLKQAQTFCSTKDGQSVSIAVNVRMSLDRDKARQLLLETSEVTDDVLDCTREAMCNAVSSWLLSEVFNKREEIADSILEELEDDQHGPAAWGVVVHHVGVVHLTRCRVYTQLNEWEQ